MSDVSFTGILPSINRNFPNVITTNSSGIIAYGCRTSIYFIDVRTNPPLVLDSKFIAEAHKGRIIGLSFTKSGETEMLASISDDHQLKIWDMETGECLYHTAIRECTRAVQWTYEPSPSLLYLVEGKYLTKFNFKLGSTVKINLGLDILVSTIVCHPKMHELAAVAYFNGTINIINVLQREVQQTFKMHSMEITSLSWSPFSPLNLLSSSLDFSIRVLKVGEQKPIFTYYGSTSRIKIEDKKRAKMLAIFHPEKPSTVLFTSPRGDVSEMQYNSDDNKPKVSRFYMDSEFAKSPFSLFFVPNTAERKNLLVCTDSFKLLLIDVNKQCALGQIPFLTSFIYGIDHSPVNPGLMAISNGDGIMKVWNTQTKGFKMDVTNIFLFYKAKIISAAWHPTEENILAFGTAEGRVGIIDLYKKKVLNHFETHHTDSVYSLCWAPCKKYSNEGDKDTVYLYSCGGGIVYIHKMYSFKNEALNFSDLAQWPENISATEKGWSEIGWKPDFSILCLGSFKGYMEVFDRELVFLARMSLPMKTVECLSWHPEKTYMSPNGSPFKSCFACSGNENDILIFDSDTIMKNVANGEHELSCEPFKKLIGHKKRVVRLSWSPHNDGFLASASKDSSALIWNVTSGTIIASYLNHRDVVLTVQWSPFDKDIVYSGGQDCCLRGWKISEQGVSAIPDKVRPRRKMKSIKFDPLSASTEMSSSDKENKNFENGLADSEVQSSKSCKDDTNSQGDGDVNESSCHPNKVKTPGEMNEESDSLCSTYITRITPESKKSLFPEHGYQKTLHNVNDCTRLADILGSKDSSVNSDTLISVSESEKLTDEDVNKFGPYLDQLTALRMLEIRGEEYKSKDINSFIQLGIMAGNIEQTLEYLAEKGALSGYLVSLAPSVSYTFWLSMCEAYAKQLLAEKRYNAASSYYLACGKVHDAVNILAGKGFLVDALVLAKARLPSSDPLIRDITFKLIKKQSRLTNKIPEAECYLSLNEPLIAAKTLAADPSPNCARVAAYICRKFNYDAEADDLAFNCLEKCLVNCNSSVFEQLVKEQPQIQIYEPFFEIYMTFHEQQLFYKNKTMTVESLFPHNSNDEVIIWKGATCTDAKVAFIEHINLILSSKRFNHGELLAALKTFTEKRNITPSTLQYVAAVINITEFLHLCHLKEDDSALHKFQYIFHSVYNSKYLPKLVCFTLLPLGLEWNAASSTMTCQCLVDENTKYDVSIYEQFLNQLIEKINSFQYQDVKSCTIIPEELELCIDYVTDRICNILSKKDVEDCVLTYFSAFLLDSMEKSIQKVKEVPCLAISKLNEAEEISQNGSEHKDCFNDKTVSEISENKSECDTDQTSTAELNRLGSDDFSNGDTSKLSIESGDEIHPETAASKECPEPSIPHLSTGDESQDLISTTTSGSPGEANGISTLEKVDNIEKRETGLSNGNHVESQHLEGYTKDSVDLIVQKDNVLLTESIRNKEQIKLENNVDVDNHISSAETGVADLIIKTGSISLKDCTNAESTLLENQTDGRDSVVIELKDEATNGCTGDGTDQIDVADEESSRPSNMHLSCVKNFEVFYTVLKFITLNTCKDEYALLYYLKKQVDNIKSAMASEVLTKASKGTKVDLEALKQETLSLLEIVSKEIVPEKLELDTSENIEKESDLSSLDCSMTAANGTLEPEAVNSDQYLHNASTDVQSPIPGEVTEGNVHLPSDNPEDTTNNSDVKQEVKEESHFETEVPAELTKLEELVSILEKNQVYYPSPFDAVPKILAITNHVMEVIKCQAIQDKLHEFIHEVISWGNKYSSVEKVLICKKCLEK